MNAQKTPTAPLPFYCRDEMLAKWTIITTDGLARETGFPIWPAPRLLLETDITAACLSKIIFIAIVIFICVRV